MTTQHTQLQQNVPIPHEHPESSDSLLWLLFSLSFFSSSSSSSSEPSPIILFSNSALCLRACSLSSVTVSADSSSSSDSGPCESRVKIKSFYIIIGHQNALLSHMHDKKLVTEDKALMGRNDYYFLYELQQCCFYLFIKTQSVLKYTHLVKDVQ